MTHSATEAIRNAIVEMLHRKQMTPAARAVQNMKLPKHYEEYRPAPIPLSRLPAHQLANVPVVEGESYEQFRQRCQDLGAV